MRPLFRTPLTLITVGVVAAACTSKAPERSAASQDAAFAAVAGEYLEDIFRRQPTQATDLGIHKYDDRLENYSRQAVMDAIAAARGFRDRANAIDPSALSADTKLDREQLLHAIDSRILTLEVVRPWAKDADSYSSGLTNTAYVMIKRRFAPPDERLRKLIAREKAMPAALLEARKNVENAPRIYTQIAIEQIEGNRSFFQTAVPGAFIDIQDKALLAEFNQANGAVIAALADYKKWLQNDLLKRSNGAFAFGEDTYRKKLLADEMIDVPLDQLLAIADRDLRKNQSAFAEVVKRIDAVKSPEQALAAIEADHPPAPTLL